MWYIGEVQDRKHDIVLNAGYCSKLHETSWVSYDSPNTHVKFVVLKNSDNEDTSRVLPCEQLKSFCEPIMGYFPKADSFLVLDKFTIMGFNYLKKVRIYSMDKAISVDFNDFYFDMLDDSGMFFVSFDMGCGLYWTFIDYISWLTEKEGVTKFLLNRIVISVSSRIFSYEFYDIDKFMVYLAKYRLFHSKNKKL